MNTPKTLYPQGPHGERSPKYPSPAKEEHFVYSWDRVDVTDPHDSVQHSYQHNIPRPVKIQSEFNDFSFTQEQPHPGISLVLCNTALQSPFTCSFAVEGVHAVFTTIISGDVECSMPSILHGRENKDKTVRLSACDAIGTFDDCAGKCAISPKNPLQYVSVVLPKQAFLNLIEDDATPSPLLKSFSAGQGLHLVNVHPGSTAVIKLIAAQVLTCRMSGTSRKLFMESKCLELLAHHFDRLQGPSDVACQLSPMDVEKLHEAQRIILQRMADPPTLRQLAQLCGTNEFKLKRDYKRYFGQTVFETLRKERLTQARRLLLEGGLDIGYVAEQVGYNSLSHFISVFKREYGITPGNLKRVKR